MLYRFADHLLDGQRREVFRGSEPVSVEPQVFDVLIYLLENRGRVVSRDELMGAVWKGRIVSDSTLTSRINAARKAIGDSGKDQRLIRTIARKGFRFVGEAEAVSNVTSSAREAASALVDPENRAFSVPMESSLPPGAQSERPGIAVLPFVNMSGDLEQEYFSDGISEDIITALSKLRWFLVIARNSSFLYKKRTVPLSQVATDLGVRYVVEGSVRKSGDRVRITAQLNDVATEGHLWSERYDRDIADVFSVQDEITEAIVSMIEPQLYLAENLRSRRKPTESMDAWDLVMRSLSHYWRLTRQDNLVAQALLEKAIALDPGYGQALGVLAASHTFCGHMGWEDMATCLPVAEEAAQAAIRADSEDPWAHFALGSVFLFTRRFDDSLAQFSTALRLNPNFSLAHGYYGLALSYCGRWEEGDAAARRALRVSSPHDPFSAVYTSVTAYAQFCGGFYDEAIKLAQDAIRQRGDFVAAHRVLVAASGMTGDSELAAAALLELRGAQPNVSLAWIESQMPIKLRSELDHYLEALQRAGLE